ncbi:hypothetical protein BC828DRAFT_389651 [Blastocladiella britannica]|nr:hypothetical protein BC828DRAFT_389651 [Blastocladiella britannica]
MRSNTPDASTATDASPAARTMSLCRIVNRTPRANGATTVKLTLYRPKMHASTSGIDRRPRDRRQRSESATMALSHAKTAPGLISPSVMTHSFVTVCVIPCACTSKLASCTGFVPPSGCMRSILRWSCSCVQIEAYSYCATGRAEPSLARMSAGTRSTGCRRVASNRTRSWSTWVLFPRQCPILMRISVYLP